MNLAWIDACRFLFLVRYGISARLYLRWKRHHCSAAFENEIQVFKEFFFGGEGVTF